MLADHRRLFFERLLDHVRSDLVVEPGDVTSVLESCYVPTGTIRNSSELQQIKSRNIMRTQEKGFPSTRFSFSVPYLDESGCVFGKCNSLLH
ncbi:hypothetical protein AVEN_194324-1 [Araneus ventricosus]|uniref:Uncharacterized protein n=1 Tax=Araneus ventricosus TaxID=182803 RepID=A0A4Y2MH77_ARAVE|nr:hypothetical protein AVEN_194324-1 [Araneus ventricosus]